MHGQLVTFSLKPGAWDAFKILVGKWQLERSGSADGVLDTFLWRDQRAGAKGGVLVVFDSEDSIEKFSSSELTSKFVDAASELCDNTDYYHAEVLGIDLLSRAAIQ